MDDYDLLTQYAHTQSEDAFVELVKRYVNLVHSAALRRTGDLHAAQEIAQAVFILLANKANRLSRRTVLSIWLYRTTQLTAANYLRTERRRLHREHKAYTQAQHDQTPSEETWRDIAPLLDEAMSRLSRNDRDVIVLRYFENKPLLEMGRLLGIAPDAAKMRVHRALNKLRRIFIKQGVTLATGTIAEAVTTHSAQAAPSGLGASVTSAALGKPGVSTSVALLAKLTAQRLLWLKLRPVMLAGVGIFFVGGGMLLFDQSRSPSDLPQTSVLLNPRAQTTAGPDPIRLRLIGTPGLPFSVTRLVNGQMRTEEGILPGEVTFAANDFKAAIRVQGPGEFGYELSRGNIERSAFVPRRITNTFSAALTSKRGAGGIPANTRPNSQDLTGPAIIRFKLLGTPGLPFKVTSSVEERTQTFEGIMPDEVSFIADAYDATVSVQGPGEFGLEVYRGDIRRAGSGVHPLPGNASISVGAKQAGSGFSLREKYSQQHP